MNQFDCVAKFARNYLPPPNGQWLFLILDPMEVVDPLLNVLLLDELARVRKSFKVAVGDVSMEWGIAKIS